MVPPPPRTSLVCTAVHRDKLLAVGALPVLLEALGQLPVLCDVLTVQVGHVCGGGRCRRERKGQGVQCSAVQRGIHWEEVAGRT